VGKSRNGGRRYSDEEVEVALTVLALNCGNARKTSEELAKDGREVPESTLRFWRTDLYADRYLELDEGEVPHRYRRAAESFEAFVEKATKVEHRLLEKLEEKEEDLPKSERPSRGTRA
jgi:hypothetical protein